MLAMTELNKPQAVSEIANWHVGFSVNDSDNRAIDCLKNAGYEVYYPQIREMKPTPKRKLSGKQRSSPIAIMEPVLVPFWPRYLFIKLSLVDGCWHDLFDLAHIRGLLCGTDGGQATPAPISDAIVEAIRAMEVGGAIPGTVTAKRMAYELGETVRINNGPLSGHNGIVQHLPDIAIERLDEGARIKLLVSLFGRASVVELSLGDIEKL